MASQIDVTICLDLGDEKSYAKAVIVNTSILTLFPRNGASDVYKNNAGLRKSLINQKEIDLYNASMVPAIFPRLYDEVRYCSMRISKSPLIKLADCFTHLFDLTCADRVQLLSKLHESTPRRSAGKTGG
jgi:hypothetical protein